MDKFNGFLTGAGTIFLSAAAWIALCKTDGVLDKLLEIRSAIDDLKNSNYLLQENTKEIKAGIQALHQSLINIKSEEVPSKQNQQEKEEALKKLKERVDLRPGEVYLPSEKYEAAEELFKTNDLNMQKKFLNQNLQIWRPEKDAIKASKP